MTGSLRSNVKFSLGSLATILAILVSTHHSFAQQDGKVELCKLDNGKTWYFSIGRTVFEIKNPNYSKDAPLVSNIDPKDALVPPNPAAPVGCEGNPQQLANFSSLNWPRLEPEGYSGVIPQVAEAFGVGRYPYASTVPPKLDPEVLSIQDAAIKCMNKKFITRFDDGTILCANKKGQLNPALNSGNFQFGVSWEFIISSNLYLTPLGQSFVVNEDTTQIHTTYRLTPDVMVGYGWFAPKSASTIDTNYLISVDKIFRATLLTYQVKNYSWPQNVNR